VRRIDGKCKRGHTLLDNPIVGKGGRLTCRTCKYAGNKYNQSRDLISVTREQFINEYLGINNEQIRLMEQRRTRQK